MSNVPTITMASGMRGAAATGRRKLGGLLIGLAMAVAVVAPAAGQAPSATGPYASLSIVAPGNEQTVHDNSATVQVEVRLEPALQVRDGHRLQITLDGQTVGTFDHVGTHTVRNVERGSHTLAVMVIDQAGSELIASPGVVFHMWQASALAPQRKQKPAPPPKKSN